MFFSLLSTTLLSAVTTSTLWPTLNYPDSQDTLATVHLWTQIVGKIRLRKMPWINHSWHVTLYVSPRGLTTGSIPYEQGVFQLEFDFIQHQLTLTTSTEHRAALPLADDTIADFYQQVQSMLQQANITVNIYAHPNEVDPAIPFEEDHEPRTYNPKQAQQMWQALVRIYSMFTQFRAGFAGKVSPVHLFWGAFDLAVTRFSGREAPAHPGGMPNIPLEVMQEAYSHEVSSAGFWLGNPSFPEAAFYSYCYPTPDAFKKQTVEPSVAYYHEELGEFILPYEAVQQAENPDKTLMRFLQTTYEAAANTGTWNRSALECDLSYLKK